MVRLIGGLAFSFWLGWFSSLAIHSQHPQLSMLGSVTAVASYDKDNKLEYMVDNEMVCYRGGMAEEAAKGIVKLARRYAKDHCTPVDYTMGNDPNQWWDGTVGEDDNNSGSSRGWFKKSN